MKRITRLDRIAAIQQQVISARATRDEKRLLWALVARITRDCERDLIARQAVAGRFNSG
jgi:hypothetical protein